MAESLLVILLTIWLWESNFELGKQATIPELFWRELLDLLPLLALESFLLLDFLCFRHHCVKIRQLMLIKWHLQSKYLMGKYLTIFNVGSSGNLIESFCLVLAEDTEEFTSQSSRN